ncbi:MAG: hypothetical protein M3Z37_00405 [Candidatus Eremiobacteraeota bacterium]|nr:hypothetical protein [Candidatus Eremiobacteraeota bacterium]
MPGTPATPETPSHTAPPIKRTLQIGALRTVAGVLTAIAVIGGAGWLWQRRKRHKSDPP